VLSAAADTFRGAARSQVQSLKNFNMLRAQKILFQGETLKQNEKMNCYGFPMCPDVKCDKNKIEKQLCEQVHFQ